MYSRIPLPCLIAVLAATVLFGTGCGSPARYIQQGNKLLEAHQYEAASLLFRKAIQQDPADGEAYLGLGQAEMARNHGLDAYQPLLTAVHLMPQNDLAKVKLADVSFALLLVDPHHPEARRRQVEALADQLTARNPNSFDGLRLKASLRLIEHKPEEAIPLFEKANEAEPLRPDLVQGWVQALFQAGRVGEGERLALQVIAKNKTFSPMYDVLYHEYERTGRSRDAENVLETRVANNSTDADGLFRLARHYASVENQEAMKRTLERIVDNPKDFPDGRLQVGNFYATFGKWDEAFQNFAEGARRNPKERLAYEKRMLDVQRARGEKDDARRMAELILKEAPTDEDARLVRASLRLEDGGAENVAAAVEQLKSLKAGNRNDARVRLLLGYAYLLRGEIDAARREFQESVAINDDDISSRMALAAISLDRRAPDEAMRYSDEVLARDPKYRPARLLRAAAMTSAGYYARARTELTRLQGEYPGSSDVQFQIGLLALTEKKYAEAEEIFRKLEQSKPGDAKPAAALAAAYSAQNQSSIAIDLLNQDLQKQPDSVPIRRLLALTAMRAQKFDLAISEYQKLLARDPKSLDLQMQLAEAYRLKGDPANAIQALEATAQSAPNEPRAAMLLASMYVEAGRYQEAQKTFQKVLLARPDNPFVINNLAFVIAESGGNLDEALQLARHALEKSPQNPELADTMGWIYLKKGDKASAMQIFGSLVHKQPHNPTYHYHYAVALFENGDRQGAKSEVQSALAARPLPGIQQKIKLLADKIG